MKGFFKKRCLKKFASALETGFVPLSKICSATIVLDTRTCDYIECKDMAVKWFKARNIKLSVIYLDQKKFKDGEQLSENELKITGKDLNWLGRPSKSIIKSMFAEQSDILINLTERTDFTSVFISACYPAKFKIGSCEALPETYNMIVHSSSSDGFKATETFKKIVTLMESIQ